MDLLSIVSSVWRHKLAALPVILLTILGAYYVFEVKPPVYESSSSFMLVNPPGPPTAAQVHADPKLAKINPNNPYADLGNLAMVADAVIDTVTSDAGQQALIAAGASNDYQVELSPDPDSPPIVDITGVGPSPQVAIRTATLVTQAARADLVQIQTEQGVNHLYMISSITVVNPISARLTVSSKLRTLIAVIAIGAILLFVVISVTDALEKRQAERLTRADARPRRRAKKRPSANLDNLNTGAGHELDRVNSDHAGLIDPLRR